MCVYGDHTGRSRANQVPCSMGPSASKAALKSKSIKIAAVVGHLLLYGGGVNHADDQMKDKRRWITIEVKSLLKWLNVFLWEVSTKFHQIPPSKAVEKL